MAVIRYDDKSTFRDAEIDAENEIKKQKQFEPLAFDDDFPGIIETYTLDELQNRIDRSNMKFSTRYEIGAPKYLASTCAYEISQMIKGESYLRLADIWFGKDKRATVAGMTLFSNKEIITVNPLRVDLALSFSNSLPPIDQVQIETICHISKMKTHIQRLAAITEITPTIPMMNTLLASILQPIIQNKEVYESYGFKIDDLADKPGNNEKILEAYSSVPVQVHIDQLNLSYIGPRDIRMLIMISRTCNAVAYGIRPLYCQTMRDAVDQHIFLNDFTSGNKDDSRIKAFGTAFNLYNHRLEEMIYHLTRNLGSDIDNYAEYIAEVSDIYDGDTIKVYKEEDINKIDPVQIRLFGIDAPETDGFATGYNLDPNTSKGAENYYEAQPYANEAKRYLEELIKKNGNKVIIKPWEEDYFGRVLGEVYLPNIDDKCANLEMIKAGLAIYTAKTVTDINEGIKKALEKYYYAELEAKKYKRNIWSLPPDKFETPSHFRNRMKDKSQKIIKRKKAK